MVIIGLVGKAGAGKDSVADVLVEELDFVKMGFADPLRRMCCAWFGWDFAQITKLEYKEEPSGHDPLWLLHVDPDQVAIEEFGSRTYGFTILTGLRQIEPTWTRRRILQHIGTEVFRAIDPDFWVKKAMDDVDQVGQMARVVFTDLRFPNEADAVRARNGAVWFIEKLGGEGTKSPDHESEKGIERLGQKADIRIAATAGDMETIRDLARFSGRNAVRVAG